MPRPTYSQEEYRRKNGYYKNNAVKKANTKNKNDIPDYLVDTADYVQIAEDCIKECCKDYKKEPGRCNFDKLTNTKMQGILTMVNDIYKKYIFLKKDEEIKNDDTDFKNDISRLKVRLVYESGREKQVMQFIKKAELLEGLKNIFDHNNKEKFIRFTRYMEALVAYHRYYNRDAN